MTGLELLKQFPKSREIVIKWFMDEMIQSFKDENVPSEFKEFMLEKGVNDDKVAKLIDLNPRMLFDVFDNNGIIILITHHANVGFMYYVGDGKEQDFVFSKGMLLRKQAEREAVSEAFAMLEKL